MRLIRRLHLYLGCFFAPLLLFYVATGWYQTFNPHRTKGLGEAEGWMGKLRSVHVDQIYPRPGVVRYAAPKVFRVLVALMALAFILTVLLGVILAFRSLRQKWLVALFLLLGGLLPMLILWAGQR